jgi:hypothetical protein
MVAAEPGSTTEFVVRRMKRTEVRQAERKTNGEVILPSAAAAKALKARNPRQYLRMLAGFSVSAPLDAVSFAALMLACAALRYPGAPCSTYGYEIDSLFFCTLKPPDLAIEMPDFNIAAADELACGLQCLYVGICIDRSVR